MHRAIVSGITGHLGQEVARQLAAAGVEVHGLTRQNIALLQRPSARVHFHRIDGGTEGVVTSVREIRPDVVFHLAAVARREHQTADIEPFVEANVLLGTQLLEGMRYADCRRLVLAGSYLQHFNTDVYRAYNLYAAMKQALEDIAAFYVDAFQLSVIRLTLSDIYSEYDKRPKLMTQIATAWKTRTPLKLQGQEAWVDPIHVEDAAAACFQAARLLESGSLRVGTLVRYSVTSGQSVSATELTRLFETLGNRRIPIQRGGTERSSARQIMPGRGETLPGWFPRVELEHGIARIIAHMHDQL